MAKASGIESITLARTSPAIYTVTYWKDGIARFDGESGVRQGAWHASVDKKWVARAAKLATALEPGLLEKGDGVSTLVIESAEGRASFQASVNGEPGSFWTLSTLVDGLVLRTRWTPMDASGQSDFSAWAAGVPVWWNQGDVSAAGLATSAGVLVLAGSFAAASTADSLESPYKAHRSDLLDDGGFVLVDDRFRLTRHVAFASPSAASSVLFGSNTSGRRAWKDSRGRAWSDLELDE